MENKLLSSALWYAKQGFSVIPLIPGGKIPPKDFQVIPYRKKIATEEEIRAWYELEPNYNIGIITGKLSNLFVVDIDTEEGRETIEPLLPENCETPIAQTPRGGKHLFFSHEVGVTIGTGVVPGVDIRGEGGYVVVAPSSNGNGKPYSWVIKPTVERLSLPISIRTLFIDRGVYKDKTKRAKYETNVTDETSVTTLSFTEGHRTDDLFSVAWALAKGGMTYPNVQVCLEKLADNCSYDKPIKKHLDSAFERLSRKERNIAGEIDEWTLVTSGYFPVTLSYTELHLFQKEEKTAARIAFHRLFKDGKLERKDGHSGWYRRVEQDIHVMDILNAPTNEFDIKFPLGVSEHCKIYSGNIVIVAGSKSAGKTAFLLNTAKLNFGKYPIDYQNSEMGETELRLRLEAFSDVSLETWVKNVRFIDAPENWADKITPEKKLFILDFLEPPEDQLFMVGKLIRAIHKKLKDGVCVIGLQKPKGRDEGSGGRFSMEKSRLYLALEWDGSIRKNRIKIVDCKAPRGPNPRGTWKEYEIWHKGSEYILPTDWKEGE